MFNIKLEEKSYKMTFKAVLVKIQWSKTDRGGGQCASPTTGADRVNHGTKFLGLNEKSKAALKNRSSEVKF